MGKIKQLKANALNFGWQTQLVASAAGSFIASYLLGIRDRHHDNILVRIDDGLLFNIDFGHILGDSVSIDTGSFAITPDLKSMMGERWEEFVDLCLKAYLIIRENALLLIDFIAMMLTPYAWEIGTNPRDFMRKSLLLDREPGNACSFLRAQLLASPAAFKTRLKNAMHSVAQGRVSTFMGKMKKQASNEDRALASV